MLASFVCSHRHVTVLFYLLLRSQDVQTAHVTTWANACKPLSEMYQESLALSSSFFVDVRVETQSCVHARQTLYHWAAPSGPSS